MKQYLDPKQLTECPMPVREKLVKFCAANRIFTWKKDGINMDKIEPDTYNLPLFSIGQLIQFLEDTESQYFAGISIDGTRAYRIVWDSSDERMKKNIRFQGESIAPFTNIQYKDGEELIDSLWYIITQTDRKEIK